MCSPLKGLLLIVPLKATRDKWRFRVCLHSVQFVSAVQYVAHHGDRLRGVQRQLYERISRRNRNRIRKYLSQFIRGPDGVDHEKNGGRKSRDTLPFNLIPGCRVSPGKKKKKISDFNFSTVYFYSIYSAAVRKHILYYKKNTETCACFRIRWKPRETAWLFPYIYSIFLTVEQLY